jgi:hypothetical protein
VRDIEEVERRLRHIKPYLFKDNQQDSDNEKETKNGNEEDDDDDVLEMKNKPVDRGNRLT